MSSLSSIFVSWRDKRRCSSSTAARRASVPACETKKTGGATDNTSAFPAETQLGYRQQACMYAGVCTTTQSRSLTPESSTPSLTSHCRPQTPGIPRQQMGQNGIDARRRYLRFKVFRMHDRPSALSSLPSDEIRLCSFSNLLALIETLPLLPSLDLPELELAGVALKHSRQDKTKTLDNSTPKRLYRHYILCK